NARYAASSMVKAAADVDRIAGWGAKSDPKAVADAMYELMTTDLRDAMASAHAPVLLVAAGDFAKGKEAQEALRARYQAQIAKAPRHEVVVAAEARHFVMYDDPKFLA